MREVIRVAMPDLLDEPMGTQAFEEMREAAWGEVGQMPAQIRAPETADRPFPAGEGKEKLMVMGGQEVKPSIGASVLLRGLSDLIDGFQAGAGVIDTRDKGQVTVIGRTHQTGEGWQAVDTFAQGSELAHAVSVALFHEAVVFKKGNIVDGAFDPCDEAGFVIELDAGRSHRVADTCSLDTGVEIVAELPLGGGGEFTPEKARDLIGFHGVDGGAHDGLLQGLEVRLATEHNIGGELHLHETPVVAGAKVLEDGTEASGPAIESMVKGFEIEALCNSLGALGILNTDEGIVG